MLHTKILKHRDALRTAAALDIPLDFQRKDAGSLEDILDGHIETVTKALETLKNSDKTADEKMNELRTEITELSQRMAQGSRGGRVATPRDAGTEFITQKAAELAALDGQRGRVELSMRAVNSGSGSAGALSEAMRDDVIGLPRRKLMVRDLLPVIQTTKGSIEYPKQATRVLNAATVDEGALKPESAATWSLETVQVRTIAHWMPASRQILEDAPQLAGLINEDLLYGLGDVEDMQLLLGDGVGQNLTGLYTSATAYAAPYALVGANKMDRIGSALLQLALTDFAGDGIVMHPSDWLRIKLLKDAAGAYLTSDPISGKMGNSASTGAGAGGSTQPMLWGVPVIPTKAIGVGKFLVGEYRAAATLYDRWEARIETSTEDRDNFIRNLVTILAEERIALAIKQAGALIKGDFSAD